MLVFDALEGRYISQRKPDDGWDNMHPPEAPPKPAVRADAGLQPCPPPPHALAGVTGKQLRDVRAFLDPLRAENDPAFQAEAAKLTEIRTKRGALQTEHDAGISQLNQFHSKTPAAQENPRENAARRLIGEDIAEAPSIETLRRRLVASNEELAVLARAEDLQSRKLDGIRAEVSRRNQAALKARHAAILAKALPLYRQLGAIAAEEHALLEACQENGIRVEYGTPHRLATVAGGTIYENGASALWARDAEWFGLTK